jgi:hypothetical protein
MLTSLSAPASNAARAHPPSTSQQPFSAAQLAPPDAPAPCLMPRPQVKNTSTDSLDGRVGRIYMPKQQVDTIALSKMKGLKRERRAAAAEASDTKKAKRAKGAAEGADE